MDELIRRTVVGFICFILGCLYSDIKRRILSEKTGKWLHERRASTTGGTYPIVKCSACMGDMPVEWTSKYCPHCGAKMEDNMHDFPEHARTEEGHNG